MSFETKKIRRRSPKKRRVLKKTDKPKNNFSFKKYKWIFLSILIIVLVPLTYKVLAKIIHSEGLSKTIIKTLGSDLPTDENGYTNFLALGVGDSGHIAQDLTDTILVASVNQKTDDVIMISIPRDLYVKHELSGGAKINTVYQTLKYNYDEETAFQGISEVVGEITGLDIHYYAKIDFQGLQNIVDALDGIDLDIKETIYDPYYPGPNYTYQTFSLGKGPQHLNGTTALKYARSRHTTSDFDRSQRQQEIIFAIKDKALQLNVLTNKNKIGDLLQVVSDNFKTNMNIREMISVGEIALDLDKSTRINLNLHDDPNKKGGFLEAPLITEEGQAYVLLSKTGDYKQIQSFVEMHQKYPKLMVSPPSIDTTNATTSPYLASAAKQVLKRFGFKVINSEDSTTKDLKNSIIEYAPDTNPDLITVLSSIIPSETQELSLPSLSEFELKLAPEFPKNSVNLILGEDFIELYNLLENKKYKQPTIIHQNSKIKTKEINSSNNEDNYTLTNSNNTNSNSLLLETTNSESLNLSDSIQDTNTSFNDFKPLIN